MLIHFPSKNKLLLLVTCSLLLTGCLSHSDKDVKTNQVKVKTKKSVEKKTTLNTTQKVVPVLCYHTIQNSNKSDGPNQKIYNVTPINFAMQMKALADNGYKTISPDELYNNIKYNKPLPEKPIMITFDDGREEQYSIGAKEMEKYNFKGVFFIMTVATGKPGYLNKTEIKALSESGNTIGCHTWDHHKISEYTKQDWQLQLVKPKKVLENITGKPITSFAYPYGVWNEAAADSLKNDGYKMAFIVYGKNDPFKPLYTIPRMIVAGSYSANDLLKGIKRTF